MITTRILIVARDALILWTKFAVKPVEFMFDAIEAELKRRGIDAILAHRTTAGKATGLHHSVRCCGLPHSNRADGLRTED
jgi:hypothetical protein